MADQIHINGIPPYDGAYDIDAEFNGEELHFIKAKSGVRAGELDEAFEAMDYDLILAFAVIAVERSGLHAVVNKEAFWKAKVGAIRFVAGEAEEEKLPPASPPSSSSANGPGGGKDENEKPASSGSDSRNGGGQPANVPSPTGTPPSELSATSESEISP